MNELGGIGTKYDIEKLVGANQQHVIARMIKWKELERSKSKIDTAPTFVYTLSEHLII